MAVMDVHPLFQLLNAPGKMREIYSAIPVKVAGNNSQINLLVLRTFT